jgi:Uncharacterized protein conserved in bacteria (DUF2252)
MVAVREIAHPSIDERKARGLEARDRTPVSSHAKWRPAADRPDPVALLEEQNRTREPDLVPVRHGRMMVSPFTFYCGAAKIMATDLKDTPVAGLEAQLCGDAHLSNFGAFASPERILLFDLNDFDETVPGPFEYDVKRMAASFTIAGRNNGFSKADTRAATLASVNAYRETMAEFAQARTMDIWYARLDEDEVISAIRGLLTEAATEAKGAKAAKERKKGKKDEKEERQAKRAEKRAVQEVEKAHTRDSLQALSKLGELVDGRYRIVSQPPIGSRCAIWPPRTGCPPMRLSARSTRSFAPTAPPCKTTDATYSSASKSWTPPARSSASAAWAPVLSSSCSRDATRRTRFSCRSRRRRHRSGALRPQEPLPAARRAGGAGAADDAGGQRHLSRLDEGAGRAPPLLLAPATGHEGLRNS